MPKQIFGKHSFQMNCCYVLKALVHVSTAFTHVNEPFIREKAYPPVTDWQKIIKMAETLDEHTLNIFTAK